MFILNYRHLIDFGFILSAVHQLVTTEASVLWRKWGNFSGNNAPLREQPQHCSCLNARIVFMNTLLFSSTCMYFV